MSDNTYTLPVKKT